MKEKIFVAIFALFACCTFSRADAICNTSECDFCNQNCTLTQGFWKNHTECWSVNPATTTLCGILWTTILDTPTKGRPWYILAHQYIAAVLNQGNGANVNCDSVSETLSDSIDLLDDCQTESKNPPNRDDYIDFAALLDDYNNGRLESVGCPPHCGGGTGSSGPCEGCTECDFCCPCDCNDCPIDCSVCDEVCRECPTPNTRQTRSISRYKR